MSCTAYYDRSGPFSTNRNKSRIRRQAHRWIQRLLQKITLSYQPYSLLASICISLLIFVSVILAYICVDLILLCPITLDRVSSDTPLARATVVANVWRSMWNRIAKASGSEEVKIKRKPLGISDISVFCQVGKMQTATEY